MDVMETNKMEKSIENVVSIESLTKQLINNHLLVIFMIINKMNNNVDPSEVLSYLNEMGYYNITALQLKSFLKDLKHLIKFVNKKKEENENIPNSLLYSLENPLVSNCNKHYPTENDLTCETTKVRQNSDVFSKLYSTGTISSKAKSTNSKESPKKMQNKNVDSLRKDVKYINQSSNYFKNQLKSSSNLGDDKTVITHLQPKYKFHTISKASSDQTTKVPLQSKSTNNVKSVAQILRRNKIEPPKKAYIVKETEVRPRKNILITNVVCEDSADRLIRQTDQGLNNEKNLPNQFKVQSNSCPKEASTYLLPNKQSSQPKLNSFIRPRDQCSKTKFEKSDPVQLYHKYKSEWNSQKIPGENKYLNLRWEMRHRMLGGWKTR